MIAFRQSISIVCGLLIVVGFTTTLVADESARSKLPQGKVKQISDWALAGAVWSDASLTKKLATEAAKKAASEQEKSRLREIAAEASRTIDELKQFGWTQVKRGSSSDAGGQSIQRSQAAEPTTKRSGLKRLDTETPAGRDDPGLDDERTAQKTDLDIDQYRVDDYVDETPAEARNLADAREDGVEAAIAAAAGRPGISGPVAGHISEREVQTRSATMPYSRDSIYDRDDYDPDVDYDVDNPLGQYSDNPQSVDRGAEDFDDDIDRSDPAEVVDGEDELIASMARQNGDNDRAHSAAMARYTSGHGRHKDDADWVQFHLDANQLMWTQLTKQDDLTRAARNAMRKTRATAFVAKQATDNDRLAKVLESIINFDLK